MWRKRHRNRRVARGNILDVRLRTRAVNAARVRLVAAAVALALGTLVVLLGLWRAGEWITSRFLYQNPAFAVTNLQVQTEGRLPAELVQAWAGVHRGENLLAIDLDRIRRDLQLVPVVESASVVRVLPGTLRIGVRARTPALEVRMPQVRVGGGIELVSYYLDSDGWVIRFSPSDQAELVRRLVPTPLPCLTGLDGARLHAGRRVDLPAVRAALSLVAAFERSRMRGQAALMGVDVSRADVVTVTTEAGSRITFGLSELERQLDAWYAVHAYAAARGQAVISLDLSVRGNAPAVVADRTPMSGDPDALLNPPSHRIPHA